MDQLITNPRHGAPRHRRILLPQRLRNAFCRLAENLQGADYGEDGLLVGRKCLVGHVPDESHGPGRCLADVFQVVPMLARLLHTGMTSSRTRFPIAGLSACAMTRSTRRPKRALKWFSSAMKRSRPGVLRNRTRMSRSLSGPASPRTRDPKTPSEATS